MCGYTGILQVEYREAGCENAAVHLEIFHSRDFTDLVFEISEAERIRSGELLLHCIELRGESAVGNRVRRRKQVIFLIVVAGKTPIIRRNQRHQVVIVERVVNIAVIVGVDFVLDCALRRFKGVAENITLLGHEPFG